jgi:hypothetical protein
MGYNDIRAVATIYRSIVICMGEYSVQEKISLYGEYRYIGDRYNKGLTVFPNVINSEDFIDMRLSSPLYLSFDLEGAESGATFIAVSVV